LAEELKRAIKERLPELEKRLKSAWEAVEFAKKLGVDVTEQELRLRALQKRYEEWKRVVEE